MERGPSLAPPAVLLAVAALPATGLLPAGPFPSTPEAFLGFAVPFVLLVLFARTARVETGRSRVLDVLVAAVVLAPYVVFGLLETPVLGGLALPAAGVLFAAASALVFSGFPMRGAGAGVAAVVVLLGVGALLAAAGVRVLPDAWNPVRVPLQRTEPVAFPPDDVARGRTGLRRGAPVPVGEAGSALAEGAGPWLERASQSSLAAAGPYVLLLDGRVEAPDVEADGWVVVRDAEVAVDALRLDAFDAVVVVPGAWTGGGPVARRTVEALAGYVRRGGALLGPAPEHPWPEGLAHVLGGAARVDSTGWESAATLGLGRVARAASEAEARDVVRAARAAVRVGTRFDAAGPPPVAPLELSAWRDEPAGRRRQGALLVAWAVVVVLLEGALGSDRGRRAALVAPAVAAAIGLVWTSPGDPGVRLHAAVFDLGGAGGRRVEAVLIRAGPAGFRGTVRWSGGGIVSLRGGALSREGEVVVEPFASAWAVRETLAVGSPGPGDEEAPSAGFLRSLLVGDPPPAGIRLGRGAVLPVHIGGRPAPEAWTLHLRGASSPP